MAELPNQSRVRSLAGGGQLHSRLLYIVFCGWVMATFAACTGETPLSPSPQPIAPGGGAASPAELEGSTAEGAVVGGTLASLHTTVAIHTLQAPTDGGDPREAIELPSIEIGETIRLTSDCATRATWRSSRPRVATVDGDGLVTGVGAGTARITETCAGVESSVIVRVRNVRIVFQPNPPTPATVRVDASGHFRVNVLRGGRRVRLTTGLASSNRDALRLKLEGDRWRWTAVGPGSAEIRVRYNGRRVLTHAVRVTRGGGGGGGGEAAEIRNLDCSATGSLITISGTVHAFRALRSVTVRAYIDDRLLGDRSLGNFRAGQSKRFSITGTDPLASSGSRCSVRVTGSEVAAQTTRELLIPEASVVVHSPR